MNAHLHIPRIIPVIFHYNQIKTTFLNFHGYDGNGGHFKIFYHKCTTTHPKKHSYEVSLQSDQSIFLPFMVTIEIFTCYSKHDNNNNNNNKQSKNNKSPNFVWETE